MQFQCQAIALFAKSELAGHTGFENNLGVARSDALAERLRGVVGDVEHRLNELLFVATELGDGRVVVAHHPQALGKFGHDQAAHPFTHLVDVDITHHMRAAVRGQ